MCRYTGINTKARIAPVADARLGSVSGSYQSRAGKISSAWRCTGEGIEFEIDTPVETELVLPGLPVRTVPAGHYREFAKRE